MKIYLGSGKDHREGFTHVDIHQFEGVDIVCDITKGLPFDDNSVDFVYSQDFLEHIDPTKKVTVINEIWRVLKNGGQMEHYVPNAGSRNDFGSPSHLSHWNLQQFDHFNIDSYRYKVDHEYEGFIGKFKTILSEEVNWQNEYSMMIPQSIHIIMEAIKE